MVRIRALRFVAFAVGILLPASPSSAQNCSVAPNSWGGAGASAYRTWCEQCNGTFSMATGNPTCTKGPNWGKTNPSSKPAQPSAAQQYEDAYRERMADVRKRQTQTQADEEDEQQAEEEAARQQQQQAELDRERDAQAAGERAQEFERDRQQALTRIQSITENELGLDHVNIPAPDLSNIGQSNQPPANTPPANGAGCKWGDAGSSVVDLRCLGLDPDRPIAIDPHVARGQQRVFPAQIDPATFQNANYNQGFECLMHFDVESAREAVEYFKKAQLERPNDPLVRNGLLLAQDILKARQQKQLEDQQKAEQLMYHGMAALLMGDPTTASGSMERAHKLDPKNGQIGTWSALTWGLESAYKDAGSSPGKKRACQFVGNALILESRGDIRTEIVALQSAARLNPSDVYIKTMLWRAQHFNSGNPQAPVSGPQN